VQLRYEVENRQGTSSTDDRWRRWYHPAQNVMNDFLILALLVAGAIILWLWSQTSSLAQKVAKSQGEVNRLSGRVQQEAMTQFQAWRQKEYDTLKTQEAEVAAREAQVKLAQWKVASEAGIRADAIQRSQSAIVGKVTEHVVPYLPEFSYNPKDARFIGSPVDFVVFDGLDRGVVEQVVFIEVKTGSGSLTRREKQVRDAVLAKNILWQEMRIEPPLDIALTHREINALYEIAQAMGSSLGVSDTMALLSSKLNNIVPFSCCALFLYDEELESLHCRYANGIEADAVQQFVIRNGHGLTGWVARNRRPLVNARPSADFEAAGSTVQTTLHSALVCPLVFNERFIGTLAVYHTTIAVYTDDHRRLLDRISEQAAAVIYNSMVFEQTQEDSLTDPLTGLPNTRSMFMHLTRELARANRMKTEVSLLVMDLDNFKKVNDDHGLSVGDRALREVARVLRPTIRPYDIAVRWMSDKFIVVLSGCGSEEAERKRLELQRNVDLLQFEPTPGKTLALAISIGAAVFPDDGEIYETLLATADSRMCRDKTRRKTRRPVEASPT